MPNRLNGQVAVVTGGNSGIGEATAHLFAKEGAKVALLARRMDEGISVEDAINANGGEAKFFNCDVSKPEEGEESIRNVVDGVGRIDILFNNAGTGDGGNFPNETNEGWERVLSVNLSGVFYMSKAVWPHLIASGGVDPADVDTSTELFGRTMNSPIMLAPTARQRDLHPDGELGMHRAATTVGTTMIVSNVSSFPFARIADAAEGPLWFQRYATRDPELNREVLAGAQEAGSETIVVTIDQQASYYERDLHDRHLGGTPRRARRRAPSNPANPYRVGAGRLWYEWDLFDELRPMCEVPMLAKGILTGEGARKCIEYGVDGIVVSNHGGRALDYGPSSLEVLEEVVDAVAGRVPVLIDSGFRRGSDALKALALGADAVCFGRASRWGLGAFGEPGAEKVLEILNLELKQAMAAVGCSTVGEISRNIVRTNFP
mgnify:CR=1 FL=1